MISEASVRRAINHLGPFGDTDLFPRLPEMRCFLERPGTIAKDCESLNIGQYNPVGVVETLTPKSWLGFLTASDNVIYLAALLDCAPNLEAARLPKDDNEAFAYRFAEGESLTIFEPARGYHQWLAHLSEFGGPENPFAEDRPAIMTDISDFYQRIYFHRIENVLQDAGCPRGPSDLVKKIIKTGSRSAICGDGAERWIFRDRRWIWDGEQFRRHVDGFLYWDDLRDLIRRRESSLSLQPPNDLHSETYLALDRPQPVGWKWADRRRRGTLCGQWNKQFQNGDSNIRRFASQRNRSAA